MNEEEQLQCVKTEYTHIGVILCNAGVFKASLSFAHDVLLKHVRGSARARACVCVSAVCSCTE